jgi:regulator of sirC expression with transglutaminase-like and TPR domain
MTLVMPYDSSMNLDIALKLLAKDSSANVDLATVALLLARDEYPRLDVEAYLSEIHAMGREARSLMRGSLRTRLEGFCRYLFHDLGFVGNTQDYYDPRNSYLCDVLDRHTGLPIALSVVAMILGEQTGLSVHGVGLPGHFIAKAVDKRGEEMLFDPFNGGKVLTPAECAQLVEQTTGNTFQATPSALAPVPLGMIVLRMLNNLKVVYLQRGEFLRAVRVIERLCQLTPGNPLELRDLGASLLRANQPGRAIDPLEAYLKARPDAGDEQDVRKLLNKARGTVAQWN